MTARSGWHRWESEVVFEALGIPCRVRTTDTEFAAIVEHLTGQFEGTTQAPVVSFSVIRDGERYQVFDRRSVRVADGGRDEALMLLLPALNSATIDELTSLAVHAGAVAADGRAVVFPGSSGTGKSTFVAACLQQGYDYITDEALVLDQSGAVLPYPKALWLTDKARRLLDVDDDQFAIGVGSRFKAPVTAAELGARIAETPIAMLHVVALEKSDGGAHLEETVQGAIAHKLLSHSFNRYARPEEWFHLVAAVSRNCRSWRLSYQDPLSAAALLKDRLG